MKLNFKVFGSGEPLIILHGLLGSLDNWQTLAKKYAEDYTVFIIDQRNHGKSPHSTDFSYPIMSEDLLEFCEQNHLYKTNIIGHSMGGKVAMLFALENPDLVDKLIIADIAPVSYPPGHNEIFDALFEVDLDKIRSRTDAEAILERTIKEFGTRQFLMKGLTRSEDNTSFEWKFNLKALWKNYDKILSAFDNSLEFDSPTLFIKGEKSKYVLPEYEGEIKKHFPNYQLDKVSKAGHWLHAENPKEFFQKSINFLKS